MLSGKVYVVTTPELPLIPSAQLGKRITGHDEDTGRIIQHNLNAETSPGYVPEIHDGTITALGDPETVNAVTQRLLQELWKRDQESEINLFSWLRQILTTCGTTAIYGPSSPLAQEGTGLAEAFWFVHRS
ncbi:MAG: hypothetical protein Q9188_006497 [Gyalolechia gomerana]